MKANTCDNICLNAPSNNYLLTKLSGIFPSFGISWIWLDKTNNNVISKSSPSSKIFKKTDDPTTIVSKYISHTNKNTWHSYYDIKRSTFSTIYNTEISPKKLSYIILFKDTSFSFKSNEYSIIEFAAAALGHSYYQHHIQSQLNDIQRHMRYMMTWSESLEWIKGLHNDDQTFYKELLTRAQTLTDANGGAFYFVTQDPYSPWLLNRVDQNSINRIEKYLNEKKTPLSKLSSPLLFDAKEKPSPHPHHHLLILPISCFKKSNNTILILSKPESREVFSKTDQVYLDLLVSQVYAGLEKNALLRELEDTNCSLRKEKKEQHILIQKLQETQDKLLQTEKFAAIGQLAAGVSHEINNPIGFISSNLNTLEEYCQALLLVIYDMTNHVTQTNNKDLIADFKQISINNDFDFIAEDLQKLVEESKEGITRVTNIIQILEDLSKTDSVTLELVDIHELLNKILDSTHIEIEKNVIIIKKYQKIPKIEAVENQLYQVLLNIIMNAIQAIDSNGSITISTSLPPKKECISISVSDTGCGIPPRFLTSLFDPFFTSKPVGKGVGLGLSLSYSIIKRHHGEILVSSKEGKGSTFTLELPFKQPEVIIEHEQT
ncbi:hypothetical protein KCM76_21860 [Zooshikella marina]|uniref:sensor histidine kinase n=1 Tax=Zooshikella ganghwensis TaxID=202772 RepID=UPI001BB0C385|nr:ATP-binding protein [Zooshikella ganghwensis]MBU2708654.1 hypothetical protein [Zooshikella ganghwensis]